MKKLVRLSKSGLDVNWTGIQEVIDTLPMGQRSPSEVVAKLVTMYVSKQPLKARDDEGEIRKLRIPIIQGIINSQRGGVSSCGEPLFEGEGYDGFQCFATNGEEERINSAYAALGQLLDMVA